MQTDSLIDAFFALLRAGLWEQSVKVSLFPLMDYKSLYQLADEQSVVGLIAAGLEHVDDVKVLKADALPFLKRVYSLENRNSSMNCFIGYLSQKLSDANILFMLIKGQAIGMFYSRPQWRAAGDIDLLFDEKNLALAKLLLPTLAKNNKHIAPEDQHVGLTIDDWEIELHGNLHTGLSRRIDSVLDSLVKTEYMNHSFSMARNNHFSVNQLNPDDNAVFIFTHFLKHFYKGGLGLRQICDWCRLLWTCREEIDMSLLEKRLRKMRAMTVWIAFAAFAVDYLGMPIHAMPFYDSGTRWSRKASRIKAFVMEVGNFGHNRDMSYFGKYPYIVRKTVSFWRRCKDSFQHFSIFPMESLRYFLNIVFNGILLAAKGK